MVRPLQPLASLDAVFQFELQLGHGGVELDVRSVDLLRREAEVRPSRKHLVSSMLQTVLASFEEVMKLVLDLSRVAAIAHQLNISL